MVGGRGEGGSGGKKEGVEWRRECWRQESMTNVAGGGSQLLANDSL